MDGQRAAATLAVVSLERREGGGRAGVRGPLERGRRGLVSERLMNVCVRRGEEGRLRVGSLVGARRIGVHRYEGVRWDAGKGRAGSRPGGLVVSAPLSQRVGQVGGP